MADLKLAKLPDRMPIKLTISLSPDLKRSLDDYAAAYEIAYGQAEKVVDLIPHIIEAFLQSDKSFARRRSRS